PKPTVSWPSISASVEVGNLKVANDSLTQALAQAGVNGKPATTLAQALGGMVESAPYAWGDYKVAAGDLIKVAMGGRWHPRGGAVVYRFAEVPEGTTGLGIKLKLEGKEVWDLVLREAGGAEVGRWTVGTDPHEAAPLIVVSGDATLNLPLGGTKLRPGSTLEVAESTVTSRFGRRGTVDSTISLGGFTLLSGEVSTTGASNPLEPAKGSLEGLVSTDLRIQSASAQLYWTTKDPAAEQSLFALTKSGAADVAYAACEALARQGTETATALLTAVPTNGPFDLNRLIALRVIRDHNVPMTYDLLRRSLACNSWRARALASELVTKTTAKAKDVILVTMLIDSEPAVREVVAGICNPDEPGTARKLLFFAVNDTSESVRLACVAQMLKATDPQKRGEALKLVRDDSTFVATSVLKMLTTTKDPADLDAIRLAIVDRRPLVQACALLTVLARDGDWTPEDIRPALKSTDARVQEALVRLAEKRPALVPKEVLGQIASSNDAWLAAEAKRIMGNGG
ncbi:MAG: hypothetical protein ABUL72_00305, partial [Armatimonadota bacterium]